jgi:hypothetical protein
MRPQQEVVVGEDLVPQVLDWPTFEKRWPPMSKRQPSARRCG